MAHDTCEEETCSCVSQWQMLAWRELFWQQKNPGKKQSYKVTGKKLGVGGDQSPQGTTEVLSLAGCLLACRYTASVYLQLVSWSSPCIFLYFTPLIDLTMNWWLVIYLSSMSSCTHFTSSSVDTMKQTRHTHKTKTIVNLSKMYPTQAVTRLVWNCISADTDTSGSSHSWK
jgi:hypothetical protein